MENKKIKDFYSNYSDKILDKKLNSPYPLRSYVHKANWLTILKHIKPGDKVLEVGCGEGVLAVLMSKKGAYVTAVDISEPNIKNAKEYSLKEGVDNIDFSISDAESLPFEDSSFDVVVADNVLEHVPNFEKGVLEIKRVTKEKVIIALPTCLNFCSICLLGGDTFWKFSRKTIIGLPIGLFRFFINIFNNGVNEGYAGNKDFPHLWRYPWSMKKELRNLGFNLSCFEASSLCLPYLNFLLPFIKYLDKYKNKPIINNFGYGSVVVLEKK